MNSKKTILITVCALAALVIVLINLGNNKPAGTGSTEGKAPAISVTDPATGKKLTSADLKGKVIFVNFWATWCPPCKEELPSISALSKEMSSNNDFRLLTILYNDQPAAAAELLASLGLSVPVFTDEDGATAKAFGITGVPETYIVDKKGMLVKKVIGGLDWNSAEAKEYIRSLLKQ